MDCVMKPVKDIVWGCMHTDFYYTSNNEETAKKQIKEYLQDHIFDKIEVWFPITRKIFHELRA